ncbi:MAG TPA: hypothetical protein VJP79_00600 [Nitrososphaera sp.]|nr:hypothetical protein [Nitrososphaera sp.]
MNRKGFVKFFKPNVPILTLTVTLIILAVISEFQTWPPDAQMMGMLKPLFYDELRPYHFIMNLWFFLSIPLLIVSSMIQFSIFHPILLEVFTPLGALSVTIYCYLVSCVMRDIYRRIMDNESWWRAQERNVSS